MLHIENLTISHAKDLRTLVDDLTFTIQKGDKVAIIGEEGSGKSTLLQCLLSPESIQSYTTISGSVRHNFAQLGYLPQQLPDKALLQTLSSYLYTEMDYATFDFNLFYQMADALKFDVARFETEQILADLSGGERLKIQLIKLLASSPDCLLLDEPSNDLDLETLEWLEKFVATTPLTVIYISHDELFLKRTATKIIHLNQHKKKGDTETITAQLDYQTYQDTRTAKYQNDWHEAQQQAAMHKTRMATINQHKSAIKDALDKTKNDHIGRLLAKKMKNIKSRAAKYEKEAQTFTEKPVELDQIHVFFYGIKPLPASKVLFQLENVQLNVADKVLAATINLTCFGQDKLGLVGKNGVGKSTLLKAIYQKIKDKPNLSVGYMPQNYGEALNLEQTPLEYLQVKGDSDEKQQIMTLLRSIQLTREEIQHPIAQLSGGQKAKLFICQMVMNNYQVLLLDEPTRNFSPTSQKQIRELLRDYPGAIIAASHDRLFLDQVCQKRYQLTPDGLELQ